MKYKILFTCFIAVIGSLTVLLAGCTTPTRNPGGYARINTPALREPPYLSARIALEKDARAEVANIDLHPIVGIGFGLVGVRLTIIPVEMAFGAFGYPFSRVTPEADEPSPKRKAAPSRRSE
jgi:hypothetical protein